MKRFEFAEQEPQRTLPVEPGLEQFLKNTSLSGDATEEEIEFLKAMKFKGKQPSAAVPNLLLPGAAKPERSASFRACDAIRRVSLTEAVWWQPGNAS
jgi:hypothetical protein